MKLDILESNINLVLLSSCPFIYLSSIVYQFILFFFYYINNLKKLENIIKNYNFKNDGIK